MCAHPLRPASTSPLSHPPRLIESLVKEDPSFKPPSDYKPRKFTHKIFIPIKQYPQYNFIGLIIGPRGNTQKTLQKDTNTKIAIRGKGSVKEGINRNPSYDYGEDEELHVMITGDTQAEVSVCAMSVCVCVCVRRVWGEQGS
jgi:splicing factor 1